MAEHEAFEMSNLHWVVTKASDFMSKHHKRLAGMRYDYYKQVLQETGPGAASSFVQRTGQREWVNPNLLVGKNKPSRPGQRWAQHLIVAAYDGDRLEGWADMANNASSNRPLALKMLGVGIAERFGKLHVPIPLLVYSRYGCVREIIGGNERQGFAMIAGAVGIRECTRQEQPLSSYPWSIEESLKETLSELGLYRNEARKLEPKDLGYDVVVEHVVDGERHRLSEHYNRWVWQEPWVLEQAKLVNDALAKIPGAREALNQVEISHPKAT